MMFRISEDTLQRLKEEYPRGCRVELIHMYDPYNTRLVPGCKGTVRCVDDLGTDAVGLADIFKIDHLPPPASDDVVRSS